MRIILSYNGKEHGILYPPLTLLSLANILYEHGYDVELVQDDEYYDYTGLPGDSPSQREYLYLAEKIQLLTGYKANIFNEKVNYELCPDFDVPLVTTSYGCQFSCTDCTKLEKGQIYKRPFKTVLEELKWITDRYDYFEFGDYNIFLDKNNFFKIIEYIPKGVKWGALINIDNNYSEQDLKYIYEKGCVNIYTGIESFNPKDLEYFKKPYYLKGIDPKEFLLKLKDIGFNINVYLIRGLPNQTRAEWIETTDWLKSHDISYTSNTFYDPVTNTFIEETAHLSKEYLTVKRGEDYNQTNKNLRKFLEPCISGRL